MATSVMVGGLRCSSCLASQWLHSISFTFALGANRPAQEQRQRMEAGTRDNESHFQGHSPYYLFRPSVPSIQVTLAVVEGSPLRGGYKSNYGTSLSFYRKKETDLTTETESALLLMEFGLQLPLTLPQLMQHPLQLLLGSRHLLVIQSSLQVAGDGEAADSPGQGRP